MRILAMLVVCVGLVPLHVSAQAAKPDGRQLTWGPRDVDGRLARLGILGSVWKRVALYHPFASADSTIDLDEAFLAAVPLVERATTASDLAAALNKTIFSALGDPLSYARTRQQADRAVTSPPARGSAFHELDERTLYVDARQGAPTGSGTFTVSTQLADRLRNEPRTERLIVDLRWQSKVLWRDDAILSLFLERTTDLGPRISRMHRGIYSETPWLALSGRAFRSSALLPARALPPEVVFLTNLNSFAAARGEFDALQAQRGVAVVLERAGTVHDDWDWLHFGDSLRIRVQGDVPLSAVDGALGARPDLVIEGPASQDELRTLSAEALRRSANRPPRPRFQFARAWRREYPVQTTILSREQRLLGLVQMWAVASTFYAYPELTSPAWRASMLPHAWIRSVESAETVFAFHRALQRILVNTRDSHVRLLHPSLTPAGTHGPPIYAERFGSRVLITRVDNSMGRVPLAAGSELLAVDGISVAAWEDSVATWMPSTTRLTLARDVWRASHPLRGAQGTHVRPTVRTPAGIRDLRLARSRALDGYWNRLERDSIDRAPLTERLAGGVTYMDLYRIQTPRQLDSLLESSADATALILDVRSGDERWSWNEGDLRDHLLARFVSRPIPTSHADVSVAYMLNGPPVLAVETRTSLHVPWSTHVPGGLTRWSKPLAVLTGPRDQSGEEAILAPLAASRRAIFVGAPTAGTNGEAPDFRIIGGARVVIAHSRATNADGSRYQGIGIVPDVAVTPAATDIRLGKDAVKEAARRALLLGRTPADR